MSHEGVEGTQVVAHQQDKNTDQCNVHAEDSAFHAHTACTLMMEEDTQGEDACDQGEGASHGLGVVHTGADDEEWGNMTLASVNK